MPLVDIQHLNKSYHRVNALHDINLKLDSGEVVGLFGPNGSGKSTLMKILAGIITSYQGEVSINGLKPGKESKALVSYLPEQPLFPHRYTARNAIRLFEDFFEDFEVQRAVSLLENFGVPLQANIKSLSKGMAEKLHIALVMSRNVQVYLLDEPMGGVDPSTRQEIITELVRQYNPEALTFISTHMIAEMEPIFDRALYLSKGELLLDGQAEDLRIERGKSLNDLFLEVCR